MGTVNPHDGPGSVETAERPGCLRTIYLTVHHVLTYNPLINILYVFVPAGIIVAQFPSVPGGVVFGLNCVAVIPLAALLAHATESFAGEMGDALGALINVTLGNAVELIIFKNEIRIVQASLLGSLLANLLLILGLAFFLGGMRYREQLYNNTVTQMSACLLSLSVVSLVLPTAFHASFEDYHRADEQSLKISRGTSTVLLVVYIIFLVFQLKSHAYLYESMPRHIVDAEAAPGPVAGWLVNDDEDDDDDDEDSGLDSDDTRVNMRHRMRRAFSKSKRRNTSPTLGPALGSRRSSQTIVDVDDALPRTRDGEVDGGNEATELKIEKKRSKSLRGRRRRWRRRNAEGEDTVQRGGDARQGHQRTASGPPQLELRLPSSEIASWTPKSPFVRFKNFAPVLFDEAGPSDTRRHSQMAQNADVPGRSDNNHCPSRLSVDTLTGGVGVAEPMADDEKRPEGFEMSRIGALIVLLIAAALVATCAEFLISSIEAVTASSPLSDTFIGLIVLPIVGNAAEHITAISVAMRNKMDLAIGVAIGSSIQIALLITPLVVLLGWILDKPMGLYFTLFETVCLFVSAFIVNFLVLDGKSNFMEGVLLCAVYLVIGIVAFFYPEGSEVSHWGFGEDTDSF
ncbi:Sodium/calcium exchanger protein-domain-containing protein [Emericellopsis atlantica]|uniref:Sodium/calcium exchanger protein-domain-containing protein n=1 Tax=Emericellopsis atlantica TaxID=2614577 RepID=A0A9P7ZQN6_9HYPO|nr:Sodium/calcium exchanger protein-domain-containing protein [Emericellopsis atlantica]KAG9255920.1 Sodium/calcium exchanger protein-domain-containing protein [Emericellopsis atlantica]